MSAYVGANNGQGPTSLGSASGQPFTLLGGQYQCTAALTSGGNVTLQTLLPDGATYSSVGASTIFSGGGGSAIVTLGPGQYKWGVTSATNVFVAVAPILQF
jgi:hypothetical protein